MIDTTIKENLLRLSNIELVVMLADIKKHYNEKTDKDWVDTINALLVEREKSLGKN